MNTIDQEKRKIEQNWIWNPMITGHIMYLRHQYGISVLSRRCSSTRDVPNCESEEKLLFSKAKRRHFKKL